MSVIKKVAFYTLGCKLNFSETSTISRDFQRNNYKIVNASKKADIYVINTCSVTQNADNKFKSVVRKMNRLNPNAFIVAIGCYAQLKPNELSDVKGVDLVLGANEKFNILDYIGDLSKNKHPNIYSCDISSVDTYISSYSLNDRTRAFLKVQDGCDYKCTYCTIPLARGISRSDTLENIKNNVEIIASEGVKEIVLTGVNIGDYGKGEYGNKKHENTFLDLVEQLDKSGNISRFRISSIEPNLLSKEIISFLANSRLFVPHFHIPLQSGSNQILKSMKRRYNKDLYIDRINHINDTIPNACIGVDVIVGFPGETDEYFMETLDFLKELKISYLHVFTYSERNDTLASTMNFQVPKEVRTKRSMILRSLSDKKRRIFYESQIGLDKTVLYETENRRGYIYGYTENYLRVRTPWNPELANKLKPVRINEIDQDGYIRVEEKIQEECLSL
ncbi:MAG: tRNA (N(6)-L-threonylcarbamoyladenosine(37)-C(2))-methylthiotransferase MtaB [Flavobacteriaceae bacterium]|nr:tRNA (N(6)-L-threonylcarbamoyladenosine(37)-C(2))-methylthiotransferase MtaB [Flavobacteriaceae bacterium]|tara:strand:+ start:39 stop:1379 length:1341 start_codon:yes stop_codon:yes gene_type:complete